MAGSVSIGTLSGVLAMRDEFSAQMSKFESRLKAIESSTTRTTRTTRTETDKISDAYKKVAASLDPVVARTQKYERTVETLNRALKAGIITQGQYNAQLAKAQIPLQSATHWTSRLGSSIGTELTGNFARFFAISALITGTIGAIVSVTRQLVQANIDAEKSQRLVEESIRRYGAASGVTVEQIDSLAQSTSRLTGIDDELLADAEALSLKFNRISTDIFPRFTQAAVDMSVATGRDLASAFEKAGKLINQPLKALTLLAREGYAVSDSQAKLIKSLLAAGEIEKAQIEILKILESQYGGAAVAARDTMGGALKALGTTWENFLERVGQDNMGPLRQALESIISLLEVATDRVDDFTVGFHLQRVSVNEWAKSVLSSIADVLDVISRVPQALGLPAAAAIDISLRARAAAAAADRNIAESTIAVMKAMGMLTESHKKGAGAALQQTEAESKLNRELKAQADQISRILAERAEQIRFLFEQRELAAKGPGLDTFTRLKEEQRINDEHEYRVSLLKSQSQFGLVIGKQLADQERIIKQLARKVKIELEISTKLLPIDIGANINRQFDNSMSDFLDELKSTEEIARRNAEAFREVGDAHEEWLEEFADGWKESFKSTREIAQDEMDAVKEAVREGLLTASEGERALWTIRGQYLEELLSAAGNFISQLGQLTKSANVQKWGTFISQAGNAASAANQFYTNPSVISMFGAAGAWLGAFVTIAEMFTKKGGVHFGAEIGDRGGSAGVVDQWTFVKGQIDEARKAGKAIANAINEIISSLGGQLNDLANFFLEQKGEGWVVKFQGGLRRYFDEFEDALAFGVSQALAMSDISNISEEIRKALQENVFDTIEELQEFIGFARDYSRLGLTDLTVSLMDLTAQLIEGARKAVDYGLEIGKITDEFGRQVSAVRDRILGIVRSPQEQLHANVVDFNRWIEQQRLAAQIQIDSANAQMIAAKMQMDAAFLNIKGMGKDKDPEMVALFQEAQRIWKDAANRLDLWTKTLDNLPPIITPEEEAEAGKNLRGTGGGGGSRQQARDFIASRRFELSLVGLTGYQRSLAELDRQYDDLIAQAGKDKKLKDDLLKLKREELALLEKEEKIRVSKGFKEFVAPSTDFDNIRETANALIADISNSPFGDERKARMLGRVLGALDDQLQALSDEMSLSLFGEMLSDMEKYGATEQELSEVRRNIATIEHILNVENYRARIELLRAEGRIVPEIMAALDKAFGIISGVDPGKWFDDSLRDSRRAVNDNFSQTVDSAADELKKLLESFKEAKNRILDTVKDFRLGKFGVITPQQSLFEAERQFNDVLLGAQRGDLEAFKMAPKAFEDLLDIMGKYSPALLATQGEGLAAKLEALGNVKTVREGNLIITDFEKRQQHREVVNELHAGFVDLSQHASNQEAAQSQMLAEIREFNNNQKAINSRLDRLESQRLTVGVKGN